MTGTYPVDGPLVGGYTETPAFDVLAPYRSDGAQATRKIGLVAAAVLLSYATVDRVYVRRAYRAYARRVYEVVAFERAKADIERDLSGTSRNIRSYGITNQSALKKLAKLVARQDGWAISSTIGKYGIKEQADLVEIARLAAHQNGWGVSQHIRNYGIDPAARTEIAKFVAQQSGLAVSEHIAKYDIADPTVRAEIARLAVQQNARGVSSRISNYCIEDPATLIEIAKLAAQQDGHGVSEYIKDYLIADPAVRAEIARLAARQNGLAVSCFIENYGITDAQALTEIALIAVAQNTESSELLKREYGISSTEELRDRGIQILEDFFAKKGVDIAKGSVLDMALKAIHDSRSTSLVAALLAQSIEFLRKTSSDEVAACIKAYEEIPKLRVHMRLPCLVLMQWRKSKDEDREDVLTFLRKKESREGMRNATTGQAQLLLRLFMDLSREAISDESRWKLLARAVRKSEEQWSVLAALFALCDQATPSRVTAVVDASSLSEALSEGIKTLLQIRDVVDSETIIDDAFLKSYGKTFGQTRVPHALLRYMKRIQPLKNAELMRAAQKFVRGVLAGTFRADRYNIEKNPHLKKLAAKAPKVFEAWQSGVQVQKLAAIEKPAKEAEVDYVAFFKQKMHDGHTKIGGVEQLPQLDRLLLNERALDQYQKQDDPTKVPRVVFSGGASVEGRACETEVMCIQLLHPKTTPWRRKELLAALAASLGHLKLKNDIEELRKGPVRISGELTVVNSDGWQDLFLCGTEVLGSCQRIDGDPFYNKCLLAYCLDGKNRLLAVKDGSGKIVARCIFRILLDKRSGSPVLFQDRIYPDRCLPEYQAALNDLASQIASEMDCPLTTRNEHKDKTMATVALRSYGGPAPYEYEDAARGVEEDGIFDIPDAYIVATKPCF